MSADCLHAFRFVAVVAARMGSSRLPGKVLMPLGGVPAILFLLNRLRQSELLHDIIVATSDEARDDVLAGVVKSSGYTVFRGSEEDVLGRTAAAVRRSDATHFVRVTGDCPFVGRRSLDSVLEKAARVGRFDLLTTKPAYPRGIDYEVAPVDLIVEQDALELSTDEREHLFNYTLSHEQEYRIVRLPCPEFLEGMEETYLLDEASDYEKLKTFVGESKDPELLAHA